MISMEVPFSEILATISSQRQEMTRLKQLSEYPWMLIWACVSSIDQDHRRTIVCQFDIHEGSKVKSKTFKISGTSNKERVLT